MIMQVHDELVFEVDAGFVDGSRAASAGVAEAPAPHCDGTRP
jgi:hypothetical protein